MGFSKGSIWRKCDLHIHNPSSILANEFAGSDENDKWDQYLTKLESDPVLQIIGSTNYFCLSGYEK